MQIIRERRFVLHPKVSLDDGAVIALEIKGMCAKSSALEVARFIRENTEENEMSVSVFHGGLRAPFVQSARPAQFQQLVVAELAPVHWVIAHPSDGSIAFEYQTGRLTSIVRRRG